MNSCFHSTLTKCLDLTKELLICIASPFFYFFLTLFLLECKRKMTTDKLKHFTVYFLKWLVLAWLRFTLFKIYLKTIKQRHNSERENNPSQSNIKGINGELLLQKHPFSSKENNSVSLKTDGHTLFFSFNTVACCMKRGLNVLHTGEQFFDS